MAFLAPVAGALLGGVLGGNTLAAIGGIAGAGLGKLLSKKKKSADAVQAPVPTPTRNMAAEKTAQSTLLARRRGVLANLITGARGSEASGGTGTKLGS